ncbi:MAG: biotin/lipoyl-containing protein, partial [Thermodesulfobacteriota bacterium]
IQGTLFVPRLAPRQERDRVRLAQWLVKPGEEVAKGQPLVTLEGGTQTWTIASPDKGVFVRPVKHRRDRVELGDTLGYVELDARVWKEEYAP